MSKQRDILPDVLAMVLQNAPDCAVALCGSVSMGYERPDSDLDLLVITDDLTRIACPGATLKHSNPGLRYFETTFDGIPVTVIYHTPEAFDDLLVSRPWRGYKFLQIEILHDPTGVIQKCKDRIAPWFEEHPDTLELSRRWLAEHAERQLSKGKKLGEVIKKFPDQMHDLWPYLDEQFAQGSSVKP
ncbi:MAG: nucleotidyltransferase domain-containing protein [Kiritimatiellae bacterium]|nr:nucleotidyltransferase domain-containing protein [Kiritimatiellia bacterium]